MKITDKIRLDFIRDHTQEIYHDLSPWAEHSGEVWIVANHAGDGQWKNGLREGIDAAIRAERRQGKTRKP